MTKATNDTDISVIKERLDWHRNIGWGVACLLGAALAGLVTWYIPKELGSLRESVKSDSASQMEPLKIQMAKVEALLQLKQSKNVSEALRLGVNFSEPKYASIAVKTIADQAKAEHMETEPSVLLATSGKLRLAAEKDPGLVGPIWQAQTALIEYRSALPIEPSPAVLRPAEKDFPGVLFNGGGVTNGLQKLDGGYFRNFVFRNVQIEYSGGPLRLENVTFINCTFVMRYSVPAQKFAELVLSQNSVTGTVA